MRLAYPLAVAAALFSAAPLAADPVVVELFTSQGCSSCPPADAMLGELAGREDVIALSLHVDYWDWIGWADTFADPAYSDRQRAYAARASSTVVYTPQFVVSGETRIGGAKGMAVAEAIMRHGQDRPEVLEVEGNVLTLTRTGRPARLILVDVLPEERVAVQRGENAGREITYHHIVRSWSELARWDGDDGSMPLPAASEGGYRVVLAQEFTDKGYPGPIVGAARVD